ncbi:ABC transporter substrate-binding protein [Streptomyces sp. NPDC013178]|uniref:ABC transporter substrate-binding protein n=1 Tax=Streptomyces sp. NPDC013178 TaxID=3155118 RepID=UPI00340A088A
MNVRSRWPAIAATAGIASTALSGCQLVGSGAPSVAVGMTEGILATDPASGYDPGSWMLFNNVFQSLLSFPNGATGPQPEAAQSCAFTDSRAKVYRCTLREGLKFSNGDSLTAKDVEFSFQRILTIDDPAGPAIMLRTLDRVSAIDERTVVFRLKVSDATFPSKIASGAGSIVNHREYPSNALRTDGRAVGSGPYKLDSFNEDKAVFSVNERYRGSAEVKNSGVTLRFFHDDQSALKKALVDGDIDMSYRGLSPTSISEMNEQEDVRVIEGNSAEILHLVFNLDDPVAGNLAVRKAMAYLLDRESVVQQVHRGTAIPLYSIVPAGITGHNTAFFDTYGARPSKSRAAATLRAAGFSDPVELTLWSTPSRYGPTTDQAMRLIAEQLNDSDLFDATVRSVPFDEYEEGIAQGDYGVYVKGWVPDYPDADNFTAPFFGAGNVLGNNYANSEITDKLLPRTAAQSDRSRTEKDFSRIEDIVAKDIPVLPVWQGKQYVVARSNVRGYQYCLDTSTVFRFWELKKA